MIKDSKKLIIIYIIGIMLILWIGGFVPKQIGKFYAINYVKKNYPHKDLIFHDIDYSPIHESYFVSFKDSNGKVYSFELYPRYLPVSIQFDPFNFVEG
ncbi:hypothetical protein [Tepidimicrobium xylanilyticum]|uniref:DUF3139 domain-containing protein n=1 Tax=Tepidimicrobium xylanilyticum TaxID=1123352 RepID=A0A1H3DJT7_9FIRM|nr:hypothetical protein [Tepidimicrobium xylanilyticum]GMG97346.1 dihydrolipoyl dehydrogenase [Tepidimicrobium xylanilyticum]SDX65919.1 hypothetical protein SAMN05660923_02687 [Tepidimicrobium xylanilyticum]